jgi:hypothetical protein
MYNNKKQIIYDMIKEFYPYAKKQLGFNKNISKIGFVTDKHNASNPYSKTAYYDPSIYKITLYISERHPKDILRSFAHELVHHHQNCNGLFKNINTNEQYVQNNKSLRNAEKQAYELGNIILRDFEDKYKKQKINECKNLTSLNDLFYKRNEKINEKLNKKFIKVKENKMDPENSNDYVTLPKNIIGKKLRFRNLIGMLLTVLDFSKAGFFGFKFPKNN